MKVLITSPSLNEKENVSGISTMVSNIIAHGGGKFTHFAAGRKDDEKLDLNWVTSQFRLPLLFRQALARTKPDIVHINTAFEPRAIVRDLVLARSAGRHPIILHVHGGRFVMQDFSNGIIARFAKSLLRSASTVIALSEGEAEALTRFEPGLIVKVLPNAVDTKQFPTIERKWGDKNIVFLGRLHEAKGLDDIVEACRMLVGQGFKFRFTCFGAGPDREKFLTSMKEVLGERFHYGGVVSGDAKVRALNDADILLLPSKFEGLPLAVLEAMAAGCVPVVSDRGSVASVVEDGRNGFLIEPGDLTQILGKLKNLLSEGETFWEEYRRNAREIVRSRFDIAAYMEKLNDLYTETARQK